MITIIANFLAAAQIHNLTIENEPDIRQCTNHAPVFRWELTDSCGDISTLMQIRLLKDDEDSLVWSSDTLLYPGNHFRFLSFGTLSDGNTYRFSIQIFTNDTCRGDNKSIYFTMNTPPSVPAIPIKKKLVFDSPDFVLPVNLSLDQQVSSAEIAYLVQILADSLATTIISEKTVSADNIIGNFINFSIDTILNDNSAYYYRIQASDGVESSPWSRTQKFFINHTNDPPGSFSLISPANGDTLAERPQLQWQPSTDPDTDFGTDSITYFVEYSTDPAFNYYVKKFPVSGRTTSCYLDNLLNHETYYWHVLAVDTKGAVQQSEESRYFTLNTGNQLPAIPRIVAPRDKQILTPDQYILWQFEDDPDRVDRLSFTVIILDHNSKQVVFQEYIHDSVVTASRFGLAEDFSIGYNNLAQYQLRRTDLSKLTDGHYYDIQIAVRDNWGGYVSTAWDNAIFQYDDNINTPPSAPRAGFSPRDAIIKTLHPLFSWEPAVDTDVRDRIKYRVQISRDSSFTNTRYIIQDSRYETPHIRLRTGLLENTNYYWRVRAIDLEEAQSPWSVTNSFTVNQYNEAPTSAVVTISPEDLTEIDDNSLFLWKPVLDPDPGDSVFYLLEIDTDGRFGSPIVHRADNSSAHAADFCPEDTLSLPLSSVTGQIPLQDNQLYFWRIIAVDRFNINGPVADIQRRFIYNPINDPPGIVSSGFSPSGGQIINTRQPVLHWKPAEDPDFSDLQITISYRIQLSPDPLFSTDKTMEYQTNPGETSFTVSVPDENQMYFYRVRAIDPQGAESAWSTINSFITNEIPEPPVVVRDEFVPKDSVIIKTNTPMITWLPTTDPDPGQHERDIYYEVRYFLTKKPKKYYYSRSEKGVPGVQLRNLKEDVYYGYQVAAVDPEGMKSSWSEIQYFGVNAHDKPPGSFQLISPRFYEDSVLTDMSFQWSVSIDKDLASTVHYTLYYSTDSTFYANSYIVSVEPNDSLLVSYRPAVPLNRKTKYFWKVAATDNEGNQTWASNSNEKPFVFTTIGYSKFDNGSLPQQFVLHQNYPNPFNRRTTVKYSVSELGPVEVVIYDILGKRIKTLASGRHRPGVYEVSWDGTDNNGTPVPGGMYICQMNARNFSAHKKVLLMK